MKELDAKGLDHKTLNQLIHSSDTDVVIKNCLAQRFIGAGMKDKEIKIYGIPGNALGAYLDGASIEVFSNAQDSVGDTMNDGQIIVHGNIGDAAGYAMRGGCMYIQGNSGYRAGIHMKEYKDKIPVMVIGGRAGSFLGEYQAGGIIIVLGINMENKDIVGSYPCTGMHGGKMYLRGNAENINFPENVSVKVTTSHDIRGILLEYCTLFDCDSEEILNSQYTVVEPDSKSPYKQMYVAN